MNPKPDKTPKPKPPKVSKRDSIGLIMSALIYAANDVTIEDSVSDAITIYNEWKRQTAEIVPEDDIETGEVTT